MTCARQPRSGACNVVATKHGKEPMLVSECLPASDARRMRDRFNSTMKGHGWKAKLVQYR